jgi:hypothetical protein
MLIDRSIEEPCEVTSLTHGFEAERRGRPLRLGIKVTRNHRIFPSDDAVEKVLYLAIQNRTKNGQNPFLTGKPLSTPFPLRLRKGFHSEF